MSKTIEDFCEFLQAMPQEKHDQAHERRRPVPMYDFEICVGADGLARTIHHINRYGYRLITVTQYKDEYTVFFRRAFA